MNTSIPPVLIIAWRRPEAILRVIEAVRLVSPDKIFIACDGPNLGRPGDMEKVAATRAIIEKNIDWPCRIKRLYSSDNQGLRLGVSRAISWFFENVDEGIILEDDCVPHPHFFYFTQQLLSLYREDSRVASIGGHNPVGLVNTPDSVVFSRYFECWGWATWKRAWSLYDDEMKVLNLDLAKNRLRDCFSTSPEAIHWEGVARQLLVFDRPSSWALRFQLCSAANYMVHALPSLSLVENIGFGPDGTNCLSAQESQSPSSKHFVDSLDFNFQSDVSVPLTVLPNSEFDAAYASLHGIRRRKSIRYLLVSLFKKFLRL